jgi:cytochrome c oxidase cbb3-type subunit IV
MKPDDPFSYEALASFAQTGGMIYFAVLFAAVCAYAFWPRNKARFDAAARMPLAPDFDRALEREED